MLWLPVLTLKSMQYSRIAREAGRKKVASRNESFLLGQLARSAGAMIRYRIGVVTKQSTYVDTHLLCEVKQVSVANQLAAKPKRFVVPQPDVFASTTGLGNVSLGFQVFRTPKAVPDLSLRSESLPP